MVIGFAALCLYSRLCFDQSGGGSGSLSLPLHVAVAAFRRTHQAGGRSHVASSLPPPHSLPPHGPTDAGGVVVPSFPRGHTPHSAEFLGGNRRRRRAALSLNQTEGTSRK